MRVSPCSSAGLGSRSSPGPEASSGECGDHDTYRHEGLPVRIEENEYCVDDEGTRTGPYEPRDLLERSLVPVLSDAADSVTHLVAATQQES